MAITLSKLISAKHKEAREIAIQMLHTLGPREQGGDGSVYTQISAIYTRVPDEFGYSNSSSQNLDRKPSIQESFFELKFQRKVFKLWSRRLRMLLAHSTVCSRP